MANILVVDDELGIRALLSEILTDEGHSVDLAENAVQARACRERLRPKRPGRLSMRPLRSLRSRTCVTRTRMKQPPTHFVRSPRGALSTFGTAGRY